MPISDYLFHLYSFQLCICHDLSIFCPFLFLSFESRSFFLLLSRCCHQIRLSVDWITSSFITQEHPAAHYSLFSLSFSLSHSLLLTPTHAHKHSPHSKCVHTLTPRLHKHIYTHPFSLSPFLTHPLSLWST